MIGLLAERPILLTGDIGTGKTFVIEQLANIIGAKLKVIQFNSETTSSDILGRLELTIDEKKINDLKKSLKEFKDKLIQSKYAKITELIVVSEYLDIAKIQEYFNKDENFLNIPDDLQKEYNIILKQLESLIGIKKTHFTFNLSVLIKAMKEGDWILLDDINFAPQEIEGLMSLLEEEPTLMIYENDPVLFFTKDKTKIKNKETDFEIHPNFRLFITSSKDSNISSAIKSRCLCIKIKPFKEPKDYAELISNSLINTGIVDKNIIEIAINVGYAFYKLKENEEQSNYILKNYILSSVNLVNLSKLIASQQPIDDKKLAQIIEFSIFSAYKDNEKTKYINFFKELLKEKKDIEIIPIRNVKRSHEYYLSMCEINIISFYYNKHKEDVNILDKINDKITNIFKYKTKLIDSKIKKDIKEDLIIKEIPRKFLLEKLELFTLHEIDEYRNDIEEVIKIFQEFLKEKDILYQYFYFLIYLKEILDKLKIINEEKLNGIKIKDMKSNEHYFIQYDIQKNKAIDYSSILYWFRNMINYFEDIIPKKIPILDSLLPSSAPLNLLRKRCSPVRKYM